MQTVNIHQAKTHLSRLIAAAVAGEPFVIAKAGKPLVKVIAIDDVETIGKRQFGQLRGQFSIPEDFDTIFQDEIIAMFEGSYNRDLDPQT